MAALLRFCFLSLVLAVCAAEETCFKMKFGETTSFKCSDECCGTFPHQYCCNDFSISGGTVAGIVIGTLVGVGLLIALLVCCCIIGCSKSRGAGGTVLQPQRNFAFIHTETVPPGPGRAYNPAYTTSQYPGYEAHPMQQSQTLETSGAPPSYEQATVSPPTAPHIPPPATDKY